MTDFSKSGDQQFPQAPQPPPGGYPVQGYPPQGQPGGYPMPGYPPQGPPVPYGPFPPLPPGVQPADRGRRVGAYFLSILLLIVTLVIGYIVWGLVLWGKGTSPALRVLGMRCVDANTGERAGFGKMALRNIVGGIVQGIVGAVTALVSFVLFLSTEKRQTLPDLIGSTIVVLDRGKVLD